METLMLYRVFNSQTKNISSAAFLLGAAALISRLLGLVRDRLLAGHFGAGEELDIYFAAFRIPDFVYGILIMGGISAVLLPVFSEVRGRDRENAWKFLNNVLAITFFALLVICGALALATPLLISLVAPGFSGELRELAVSLTRIMFLSPILLGLSSIFSAVLQYFHRFLAYSLAPIFYNIGIIIGVVFFVPLAGLQGLAYGVILGAALHFIIQIPAAILAGWRFKPAFFLGGRDMKNLFRLLPPRFLSTGAYHVNLIALTAIGSMLGGGAIAVFNFANNLQYLPIGLIGVSFAAAVFPALSKSSAERNNELFWAQLSSSLRQTLFFVIPISLLLVLLRAHVVRVVLGTGEFGWEDTRLVAASLAAFAAGIFAAAIVPILSRALFALRDTKTPAVAGSISTVLSVGFAIFFARSLGSASGFRDIIGGLFRVADLPDFSVIGLPLAVSIAVIIQCVLLGAALHKRFEETKFGDITRAAGKMLAAGAVLVAVTYGFLQIGGLLLNTSTFWGIFWQAAAAGTAGMIAYFIAAFGFNLPEAKNIRSLMKIRLRPNGLQN